MLARKSRLVHPSGVILETPLLIPSFSSKGFSFADDGKSESASALTVASQFITESMLISAYDLFYKYLPTGDRLDVYPQLTFVDSGGYETSDSYDLSAALKHPIKPEEWTEKELLQVYSDWDPISAAVFVSYDHPDRRIDIPTQVADARKLFQRFQDQLHCLLIKPETQGQQYIQLPNIIANVRLLSHFDIIGFTEKELSRGNSVLGRMQSIAQIRRAMDREGITKPIHIFGSLDTISCCLYFLAGAEIFDGLTWLRYSYRNGLTIYQGNYGALETGIEERDNLVRSMSLTDNLRYLRKLQIEMRSFLLDNNDFDVFSYHSDLFRRSWDALRTKIGEN